MNSLSQNLTVLTAPSEREPLARPETLCFSWKLHRYAKGPISEGAVAEGDWGSSGKNPFSLCYAKPAPPRGRLWAMPETLQLPLKPSPWGRWLDAKRQDGRGIPRSAALSQKAALQLPFPSTTPPVKMGFRKVRRLS